MESSVSSRERDELYREVGKVMAKYTSGTIPKAFKILPTLTNWEQLIQLTVPERWSSQSVYEATVLFSSNLKSDMAQRFYHNILLPRLRSDIDEYKKLNFHLYNALKRSLYKPAAFYKGIILPLCEDPDCALREAFIISSVVKRKHVPLLHSAAAMLKIAEMPYTTARGIFLIDLISKNYALPYRVVDAIVDHFIRYTYDDHIELNVQWHKTLLKFCQLYAQYLAPDQREALKDLVKHHSHHQISPEVISIINLIPYGLAVDDETAWLEFKQSFGKRYATRADEDYRKQIFLENKHYIEKHNDDKSVEFTFTSGINRLSDLSTEEVNNKLTGFKPKETIIDLLSVENYLQRLNASWYNAFTSEDGLPVLTDHPDSVGAPSDRLRLDWREHGRVLKVKDQGSCGSCWAFAAVGSLEGMLASRGHQMLLSEQNLVDCSSSYGNEGCHGGLMDSAFKYVRDYGIMTSRDYKYIAKQEKCRFNPRRSVMKLRGASRLPQGDEALVRRALNLIGPIPVALDASLKSFHTYKSGIYNDDKCKSAMKNMSHAVLLVGYGTDRFGRDYWIVKNSWGTSWGERGFMRISRSNNLCGITTYAVVPLR